MQPDTDTSPSEDSRASDDGNAEAAGPNASAQRQKIVLYSSATCGYCWRAERLLTKKGYAFETVDVTFDRPARAWLAKESGQRTVPQIKIGQRWVGGFEEIDELDARGELDRMVR